MLARVGAGGSRPGAQLTRRGGSPRIRVPHEENLPAQQPSPQEDSRLPRPDEDEGRPRGPGAPPRQGPEAPRPLSVPARPAALPRARRIAARRDYQRTYDEGAKRHGRYVVVFAAPNGSGLSRLGVTVTKKVGGAVLRNLLKRRVREVWRGTAAVPGRDVVVNLKREAAGAAFDALRADLTRALVALGAAL
jgi:ribonuclease P protein component